MKKTDKSCILQGFYSAEGEQKQARSIINYALCQKGKVEQGKRNLECRGRVRGYSFKLSRRGDLTETVLFQHIDCRVHLEATWLKLFLDRRYSYCRGPGAEAHPHRMRNSQEARRGDGREMRRVQTRFRALAAIKDLGCDSKQWETRRNFRSQSKKVRILF